MTPSHADLEAPPVIASNRLAGDNVLEVEDLGKCYRIYPHPADRLRQAVLGRLGYVYYEEKWALQGVSFALERGTALGIIGRNGAGKSTLLQIVAGTLAPTTGRVAAAGRIVALLELGSGFNPEFTGRENVFLYGALYGLSRRDIEDRFDAIAAFADIGAYLDRPLKMYSTGMAVRLAFAVIAHLDPDILVVDEALAVGDVFFQHKCMRHIARLLDGGASLLFASHAPDLVKRLCQRGLWIADGRVGALGGAPDVVERYLADVRMEGVPSPVEPSTDDAAAFTIVPPSSETLPLKEQPLPGLDLMCAGAGELRDVVVGDQSERALVLCDPAARLGFRTRASALELVFGAHPNGGKAMVAIDGAQHVVNLFSPVVRRLHVPLPGGDAATDERAVVMGLAPQSEGRARELWFLEALPLHQVGGGPGAASFKTSIAFDRRTAHDRYGAGGATIRYVELLDQTGTPLDTVPLGDTVTLRAHFEITTPCAQIDVSFIVRDRAGQDLFGTTTYDQGVALPGSAGRHLIDFVFRNNLRGGSYSVHVALVRRGPEVDDLVPLDVVQIALVFEVPFDPTRPTWYMFHEPVTITTFSLDGPTA